MPHSIEMKFFDDLTAECSECGAVLSEGYDIRRHVHNVHRTGMTRVRYRCSWVGCDVTAVQRSNLKTHYRVHLRDKSQTCPDCQFRTTDPASVTRHRKRIHGYVPMRRSAKGRRDNRYTPYGVPASPSSGSESDNSFPPSSESVFSLASEVISEPSVTTEPALPRSRNIKGRRDSRYIPYAVPGSPSSLAESDGSFPLSSASSLESVFSLASEALSVSSTLPEPALPRSRNAKGRRDNRYTPYAVTASPSSECDSDNSFPPSSASSSESVFSLASEGLSVPSTIPGPVFDRNGLLSSSENHYKSELSSSVECNASFDERFPPLTPRHLFPAVESTPPLEMFKPFDYRGYSLLLGDLAYPTDHAQSADIGVCSSQTFDEHSLFQPAPYDSFLQQMAELDPSLLHGVPESDFQAIFGSEFEHYNFVHNQKLAEFPSQWLEFVSSSPNTAYTASPPQSSSSSSRPFNGSLIAELYAPLDL
ncbi:hypothetical protein GYMLUDRAFT_76128 [Collybiopsis luxurians FD-317 M1]|uniref:C2H2-type domain-containing protein n=1 Tax=Collybiopsis luxurians FD-317 M1 TaxID=944289 RepID=A0A0D0CE73_9AGAR|nr:hypothetical protein GYMLUDRAFT_76128 [Collybiopsis luxurians FD-317 M1]